jgi:hypothetical protein
MNPEDCETKRRMHREKGEPRRIGFVPDKHSRSTEFLGCLATTTSDEQIPQLAHDPATVHPLVVLSHRRDRALVLACARAG